MWRPVTARRIEDARISDGCFNRIGVLYCPISFQCHPDAVASDFLRKTTNGITLAKGEFDDSQESVHRQKDFRD